jgi:acylglycerol lipase
MTHRPTQLPTPEPIPPGRQPTRLDLALPDGYETTLHVHQPPADAPAGKLPVIFLHGIQSHPGWFFGSARALAEAGHAVYQLTRRGSGSNDSARGHCASPAVLLDDLGTAVDEILRRENVQRCHLLGVSWGGKWAAAACGANRDGLQRKLASLTMIAPGIAAKVDVSPLTKLAVAGALLLPGLGSRAIFDVPLRDEALFTDSPAGQDFIRTDPLSLRNVSAKFLFTSRRLDRLIARTDDGAITLPAALILSQQDRIIDNDATTATLRRLCRAGLVVDTLAGAHTLEFDAEPGPFLATLTRTLTRHESSRHDR